MYEVDRSGDHQVSAASGTGWFSACLSKPPIMNQAISNIGVIGLMDALRKFDPSKSSFESYAAIRIKGQLLMKYASTPKSPDTKWRQSISFIKHGKSWSKTSKRSDRHRDLQTAGNQPKSTSGYL